MKNEIIIQYYNGFETAALYGRRMLCMNISK